MFKRLWLVEETRTSGTINRVANDQLWMEKRRHTRRVTIYHPFRPANKRTQTNCREFSYNCALKVSNVNPPVHQTVKKLFHELWPFAKVTSEILDGPGDDNPLITIMIEYIPHLLRAI